jgi:hypothetical protein
VIGEKESSILSELVLPVSVAVRSTGCRLFRDASNPILWGYAHVHIGAGHGKS